MKLFGLITLTALILSIENNFMHQDRIEKPITIQFVCANLDTIILSNKDSSLLELYCEEILEGKRKLLESQLSFKTGETILFQYETSYISKIKLTDNKKELYVLQDDVRKVKDVHYQTVALLWDGRCKNALEADYCYIQFEIGTEKSFDKYPYVQLFFKNMSFFKSTIWKPNSENGMQSSDF